MADGREEARVTIRTVAADAGVSVAAVSKVLRNAYGVSDALRAKVEASIERLGYRPSVAARGMRGQTFTLGVLLVEIANPFLPSVYHGIESVTDEAGYKVMVGVGAAREGREAQLIEQMIDNRMDGLILVASQISGQTLDRYARQIPTVVVGHHEPTAQSFDTINSDDFQGAQMVVRAFVELGHRDIAMLAMDRHKDHAADVSPQREDGYLAAMKAAGLTPRVLRMPPSNVPREEALRAVLADPPRALFCWSDLDAVLLVNMAHEMGIRVPEDMAIVGYDDSPVAGLPLISLASVDQDGRRMGQMAAQALLARINGRQVAEHRLITPNLVRRRSLA